MKLTIMKHFLILHLFLVLQTAQWKSVHLSYKETIKLSFDKKVRKKCALLNKECLIKQTNIDL